MPSELAGGNEVWRHIQIPLHGGARLLQNNYVVDPVKWNVFLAGRCWVEPISAVCEHTSVRVSKGWEKLISHKVKNLGAGLNLMLA